MPLPFLRSSRSMPHRKSTFSLFFLRNLTIAILPILALLTACMGEDRSGEQPFAPTVKTLDAVAAGDSALLRGQVLTSPNSDVTACGFNYGNDTLRKSVVCAEATTLFEAYTDSLGAGTYFAVAYATNGIGTTYADTVYFTITH